MPLCRLRRFGIRCGAGGRSLPLRHPGQLFSDQRLATPYLGIALLHGQLEIKDTFSAVASDQPWPTRRVMRDGEVDNGNRPPDGARPDPIPQAVNPGSVIDRHYPDSALHQLPGPAPWSSTQVFSLYADQVFALTASTSQGVPCSTALEVDPSRRASPCLPWLPTTIRSTPCSLATR